MEALCTGGGVKDINRAQERASATEWQRQRHAHLHLQYTRLRIIFYSPLEMCAYRASFALHQNRLVILHFTKRAFVCMVSWPSFMRPVSSFPSASQEKGPNITAYCTGASATHRASGLWCVMSAPHPHQHQDRRHVTTAPFPSRVALAGQSQNRSADQSRT